MALDLTTGTGEGRGIIFFNIYIMQAYIISLIVQKNAELKKKKKKQACTESINPPTLTSQVVYPLEICLLNYLDDYSFPSIYNFSWKTLVPQNRTRPGQLEKGKITSTVQIKINWRYIDLSAVIENTKNQMRVIKA